MRAPFRITSVTLDVMEAFLAADDDLHGFAVARAAGKPTGSIYPILVRLEGAGWLESRWESEHPDPGRPRRRFYSLTAEGMAATRAIVLDRRGKLPVSSGRSPQLNPRPSFGFASNWEGAR